MTLNSKEFKLISMDAIKGLLRIIKKMVKGSLFAIIKSFIQDIGVQVKDMELACGLLPKEIHMLENGIKEKFKDKEYIKLRKVTNTKELLKTF